MTVRDLSRRTGARVGVAVRGRHRTGRSVAELLSAGPPSSAPVVPPTGSTSAEPVTVVLDSGVPAPRRSPEPQAIPSPRRAVEPFEIPAPRPADQELLPVGCVAPAGPERPSPYRWRPDVPSPRRFTVPFTKPFGVRLAAALIGLAVLGSVPSAAGRVIEDRGVPDHTRVTPRPALPSQGTSRTLPGALDAARGSLAERAPLASPVPVEFTDSLPDARAAVALGVAMAQLGLPYQWGGDGPTAGDAGFDCSGLTAFAYAAAGIRLPRTAHTQFGAGPHVPAGSPLQPGDLLFYGTPDAVHHVGMYLGDGRMVNAPTFGQPVRTAYYRWRGDDYLGATRPAAGGLRIAGQLPFSPVPVPATTPRLRIFEAPAAPLPTGPLPTPSADLPPEPQTAAAAVAAAGPAVSGDRDSAAVHPSGMRVDDVPPAEPASTGAVTGAPAGGSTAADDPSEAEPGAVTDPEPAALAPAAAAPVPAHAVPGTRAAAEPAANGPAATDPAAATPTTATPSTADPTTMGPASADPTTTAAPTTAAPTTAAPTTTPPTTAPAAPRHVTLSRPSEFPLFPGPGASRTVFDLDDAAPVQDLRPGDVVDAALPDGSTRSFTVRTREILSAATAATVLKSSAEPLVVRAPLPDGTFLVLTGVPAAS
jgi:cell wall-associated NlpC family hydrolase